MTKEKRIRNILTEMDDSEIVTIWNEYCYESNNYDNEILDAGTLEDLIENSGESSLFWVNRFFYGSDDYSTEGSANPNRDYFTFNGYGNIVSFDYIYNRYEDEFSHIDESELINYIIENKESFGNDEIEEVLADQETEEE